jgi:hypothetical protein
MPDPESVVAYPDHPFLIRGPDVLVGLDDRLIAYFAYSGAGVRPGSGAGWARRLLSRLALPQGTLFVLVVASTEIALHDDDLDLFDAIQFGIRRDRRAHERWDPVHERPAALVGGLRPFHLKRFSDAWATREDGLVRRQRQGVPTSRLRPTPPRRLPAVST